MTEHLNYCRQIVKQYSHLLAITGLTPPEKTSYRHAIDLCYASQKFILPDGGHILADGELRALDEMLPLRLPYKFIALEYKPIKTASEDYAWETVESSKRVVFARDRDDGVYVTPACFHDNSKLWIILPEAFIPSTDYLDRSNIKNGNVFIKTRWPRGVDQRDYYDEVSVLLTFLNALACSNVNIEKSIRKNQGKKVKAALQFYDYHILTINVGRSSYDSKGHGEVGHRSPREHLRRGHIVRPQSGRPYWRNSTIVNAGRGFGKVDKNYQLRAACQYPET